MWNGYTGVSVFSTFLIVSSPKLERMQLIVCNFHIYKILNVKRIIVQKLFRFFSIKFNKWYSSNVFLHVGHKGLMDLSILHLLAGRRLWLVLRWNIFLAKGAGVIFCKRLWRFKEALLISGTIFSYLACDCLAHLMPQISIEWFCLLF